MMFDQSMANYHARVFLSQHQRVAQKNHNRNMDTLGERIKAERKRLKLNQAELAKRVDPTMGQSFISNLETGYREDTPYIPELAHIFGVDAYWLKTGKGERRPAYMSGESATRLVANEPAPKNVVNFPNSLLSDLLDVAENLNDSGLNRLIGTANALLEIFPRESKGKAAQ